MEPDDTYMYPVSGVPVPDIRRDKDKKQCRDRTGNLIGGSECGRKVVRALVCPAEFSLFVVLAGWSWNIFYVNSDVVTR